MMGLTTGVVQAAVRDGAAVIEARAHYYSHGNAWAQVAAHGNMWSLIIILLPFLWAALKGVWAMVSLAVARRRDPVEATVTACESQSDIASSSNRVTIRYVRHGLPVSRAVSLRRRGSGRAPHAGDTLHVWVNDLPPWALQLGIGRDFVVEKVPGYIGRALWRVTVGVSATVWMLARLGWGTSGASTSASSAVESLTPFASFMDLFAVDAHVIVLFGFLFVLILIFVQELDW